MLFNSSTLSRLVMTRLFVSLRESSIRKTPSSTSHAMAVRRNQNKPRNLRQSPPTVTLRPQSTRRLAAKYYETRLGVLLRRRSYNLPQLRSKNISANYISHFRQRDSKSTQKKVQVGVARRAKVGSASRAIRESSVYPRRLRVCGYALLDY